MATTDDGEYVLNWLRRSLARSFVCSFFGQARPDDIDFLIIMAKWKWAVVSVFRYRPPLLTAELVSVQGFVNGQSPSLGGWFECEDLFPCSGRVVVPIFCQRCYCTFCVAINIMNSRSFGSSA